MRCTFRAQGQRAHDVSSVDAWTDDEGLQNLVIEGNMRVSYVVIKDRGWVSW